MKRKPSGYTIIEVMIFLLISSALLGSVMIMISGRQERTRFSSSAEGFERRINDITNDVSTGFYPSANNISCTSSNISNDLTINTGSVEQGSNGGNATVGGCVFLGRALELGIAGAPTTYKTYTVVGSKNGTDLATSKTKLLGMGEAGIFDQNAIPADIEVVKVVSNEDSSRDVKGIAIISDFSQTSVLDNKVSGNAARVSLFEIPGPFAANAGKPSMQLADQGVTICLQQGTGGRKASVIVGAAGGRLSTQTKIEDNTGVCP